MSATRSQAAIARLVSLLLALALSREAVAQGQACTPTAETFNAWKLHTMCLASRREVPRALAALGVAESGERGRELGGRLRQFAMPEAQDQFLKAQSAYESEGSSQGKAALLRSQSERALAVVRQGLDTLVANEREIAKSEPGLAARLDAAAAKTDSVPHGSPGIVRDEISSPSQPGRAPNPSATNDSVPPGAPGAGGDEISSGGPLRSPTPSPAESGKANEDSGAAKREGSPDLVDLTKAAGRKLGGLFGKLGRAFGGGDENAPKPIEPEPIELKPLPVVAGLPAGLPGTTIELPPPPPAPVPLEAKPNSALVGLPAGLLLGTVIELTPPPAAAPPAPKPVAAAPAAAPTVGARVTAAAGAFKDRIAQVYGSYVGAQKQLGVEVPPEAARVAVATMFRESSGNPLGVGDHGRARGYLQMHPAAAQDAGCSSLEYKTGDMTCAAKWSNLLINSLSARNPRWYEESPEAFGLMNVMGFTGYEKHVTGRRPQPTTERHYLGGRWGLDAWMERVGSVLGLPSGR